MSATDTLSTDMRDLYEQARAASQHAYVPYSHYPVGAALRSADGTVVTGCNVENASFGLTICAERNAATTAVGLGHTKFDAIAIHVDAENGQPCGACRQFLAEWGTDLTVVYRENGELRVRALSELLPHAFIPTALDS